MYPATLYPGYSWSMTHHMGIVDQKFLYNFLLAAVLHRDVDDPATYINNYMIVNNLLPPNIRKDTGQPDIWRDYQQILGDLGLMFSTKYVNRITPTPTGLAYLDDALSFSDVMILQAFRYQYPNGHRFSINGTLRKNLHGSFYGQYKTLTELQAKIGVYIRPAVLIWRVLHSLRQRDEKSSITVGEIKQYLMRCVAQGDTDMCIKALIDARNGKINFEPIGNQRDALEWIHILVATPYFTEVKRSVIELSRRSIERETEIDKILSNLEQSSSFWKPQSFTPDGLMSWYDYFGTLDLGTPLIPLLSVDIPDSSNEILDELDAGAGLRAIDGTGGSINLREFNVGVVLSPQGKQANQRKLTIDLSYDAELIKSAARTHNSMVKLIAEVCRRKGARIMEDPSSVDLLIEYEQHEFIVEIKSVTPRNFTARLRYAIGQLLQYDYLRSAESPLPRRKVIALAAQVPMDSWCVPFLNNHLNIDLLSLSGRELRVNSLNELTNRLFSSE